MKAKEEPSRSWTQKCR